MKKIIVLIVVFIMIISLGGCKQQQTNPPKTQEPTPQTQDTTKPSIGNIHLGDSKEEAIKAFGKDYIETYEEDPGILGEPYYKWVYDSGITLFIGKNTNGVLEIESKNSELSTNLGIKIGDTFDTVNKKYSVYNVATSNQDNSKLVGWYELGEGQLIILDFDLNDDAIVNTNVKPDSKVQMMRITYERFID